MKKIMVLIVTFLIMISCSEKPKGISNELYTISEDNIDIHFSKEYKAEDLHAIKSSLDSFGIFLVYDSLKYDEKGYLKKIAATIYYPNNTKSSFSSRELTESDRPGFKYHRSH